MTQELTNQVVVNNATSMLQAVGSLAVNPDVDVDKVERLMQIQEKLQAKENEDSFNRVMAEVQSKIGTVLKNKLNKQTNSNYADLQAIVTTVKPIYTSAGMALSFNTIPTEDQSFVRVVCYVTAEGHTRTYEYDSPITDKGIAGKVMMTTQHARGSAISYGRRYLVCLIFNIATDDDDGNSYLSNVEYITEEEEANLIALIEEVGADKAKFLKVLRIDEYGQLPKSKLQGAIKRLEERRKHDAS